MRHTVDILPFFFVLFFCFGPDDVTLFRSISKRKQKKEEEKVPINNTPTPQQHRHKSSTGEKHPKTKRTCEPNRRFEKKTPKKKNERRRDKKRSKEKER